MRIGTVFGLSGGAWVLASVLAACGGDDGSGALVEDTSGAECTRDAIDEPEQAPLLALDSEQRGYICPLQDQDWYEIEVTSPLVEISLEMASIYSGVPVTYGLYPVGSTATAVATPDDGAVGVGRALKDVHCVTPGSYVVSVRSQDLAEEDRTHEYSLSIAEFPEPDSREATGNDSEEQATALALGEVAQGYIACRGDEDWFAVDVSANSVVQLQLTMPVADVQLQAQLIAPDGTVVETLTNESLATATNLSAAPLVEQGGTYYVRVADDDGGEADAEQPYELQVLVVDDEDVNEPNDHPDTATPLAAAQVTCGASWQTLTAQQGTIASSGDQDYFVVNLSGCQGGLLEATLRVEMPGADRAQAWALQDQVQASLALVRSHNDSSCSDDTNCVVLNQSCDPDVADSWACEGYFNACSREGRCTGATVCLPGNVCGAYQVQRAYSRPADADRANADPPANEVTVSAPILANGQLYLQVADFGGDGGTPDAHYTLQVQVRADPDGGDATSPPNNLFGNTLTESNFEPSVHFGRAVPMEVYAAGGCDTQAWASGSLGYENDMDWFVYQHPCEPETDCMLRMRYEVDGGEVDHGLFIYGAGELWFSREMSSGTSGVLLGSGASAVEDQCFYGSLTHQDPYYVVVRDLVGDGRDWNADQNYRFCIEKVADGCLEPCTIATTAEGVDECTTP